MDRSDSMVGDCDTRVDVQLLGLVHMEYLQLEIIDVLMTHRARDDGPR